MGKRKEKVPCKEAGCKENAVCKGLCANCYASMRRKLPEVRVRSIEYSKTYNTPERRRAQTLAKYGLTPEHYEELVQSQSGLCAICKKIPSGEGNASKFHVDHCHDSGKVRGLLCSSCNTGLGLFKHKIENIRSAIRYAEMWHQHRDSRSQSQT